MPFIGRADYPLISHKFSADPSGLEYNGRLYLYCSNDTDNDTNGGYAMHSISCYSSDDLKNWTDHGEVLQVPRDVSWATYSWAPSVITNNGLFYLYFGNNAAGIGVATSSVPTGPFKDARGSPLINSSTPGAATANQWYFDPCVFIDNNQPYLYFGGADPTNARVILLNTNMTGISGSAIPVTAPNFFEASYMHKRGDIYYFSYSSRPSSGLTIQYATNSNPASGFTFVGDVVPNPPHNAYNNNQQSFFTYHGIWYCAYHNRYVAEQLG
ncbi:MAG TPA: family 43 glycosylhydrolase, partial [Candidatus Binatia bacterium]|nr:family 43 glycosylhydrolase [Candidatus Binatia bacterium]